MSDFWDYVKNLFKKAEESSPSNPVVHELIKRSAEEYADYEEWKNSLIRRRLTDWLGNQFTNYQLEQESGDEVLDFLNTPSAKGFVIYFFKTRYTEREVNHFFDFLKEQVQQMNYRIQISDTRTYNRNKWVERLDRHYLKPRIKPIDGQKLNQRYGNILIELQYRGEQVHHLRFRATSYQDHLFTKADAFEELMQRLLMPG